MNLCGSNLAHCCSYLKHVRMAQAEQSPQRLAFYEMVGSLLVPEDVCDHTVTLCITVELLLLGLFVGEVFVDS